LRQHAAQFSIGVNSAISQKAILRPLQAVFQYSKQRLRVGIIIADSRSAREGVMRRCKFFSIWQAPVWKQAFSLK
jgi:hypothetical protein